MRNRHDESTAWIGYSDFLTTLALLFLVVAAVLAAGTRTGPAYLKGAVTDARTTRGVDGCSVRFGTGREQETRGGGSFAFQVDGLGQAMDFAVDVLCNGYGAHRASASLSPGDTTRLPIVVNPIKADTVLSDSSFQMRSVPGDALFESNEWWLRDQAAINSIKAIGYALRAQLRPDEVVAVAGHTDDAPFPPGANKDNWMLSGERASSAARVLTDPMHDIGLPACRVVIMGFGPSRPVHPVYPSDDAEIRRVKRRANRRIEFRVLRGDALAWGGCG